MIEVKVELTDAVWRALDHEAYSQERDFNRQAAWIIRERMQEIGYQFDDPLTKAGEMWKKRAENSGGGTATAAVVPVAVLEGLYNLLNGGTARADHEVRYQAYELVCEALGREPYVAAAEVDDQEMADLLRKKVSHG